jgi:hypothetical protein
MISVASGQRDHWPRAQKKPTYATSARDRNFLSFAGRFHFMQVFEFWILVTRDLWDCKSFPLNKLSVMARLGLRQISRYYYHVNKLNCIKLNSDIIVIISVLWAGMGARGGKCPSNIFLRIVLFGYRVEEGQIQKLG